MNRKLGKKEKVFFKLKLITALTSNKDLWGKKHTRICQENIQKEATERFQVVLHTQNYGWVKHCGTDPTVLIYTLLLFQH